MENFSFSRSINLAEERKWLLAVLSFEVTNSVSNINNEDKSFSISTPGHWNSEDGEELVNKPNKSLELRSENDIDLHVEEVRKRRNQIKIGDKEYKVSDLDTRKIETIKQLKNIEYNDLEDMVYRMELTYDEIIDILDVKLIAGSTTPYTIPPGICEISDINLMINFLLPNKVKVNFTIDDIIIKSNLTTNKTLWFTKKSFFYTILGSY